jgi:hypothetical protein
LAAPAFQAEGLRLFKAAVDVVEHQKVPSPDVSPLTT